MRPIVAIAPGLAAILCKHLAAATRHELKLAFTADAQSGRLLKCLNDVYARVRGVYVKAYTVFGQPYSICFTADERRPLYTIVGIFPERPSKGLLRDLRYWAGGLEQADLETDWDEEEDGPPTYTV
ncbi:MAG: hypothetical protein ACYC7E_11955 [Armatimonadota bacterium]